MVRRVIAAKTSSGRHGHGPRPQGYHTCESARLLGCFRQWRGWFDRSLARGTGRCITGRMVSAIPRSGTEIADREPRPWSSQGQVHDPLLPLRRRFTSGRMGHEARRARRLPRSFQTDSDLGAGSDVVRAPADVGKAGSSSRLDQFGWRYGEHERSSRRLLLQPDWPRARSEFSYVGQQPHSIL